MQKTSVPYEIRIDLIFDHNTPEKIPADLCFIFDSWQPSELPDAIKMQKLPFYYQKEI